MLCKKIQLLKSIIPSICTEPNVKSRQKRVIGGIEIEKGDWPWLVHLKGRIPSVKIFGIPLTYKVSLSAIGPLLSDPLLAEFSFVQPQIKVSNIFT